MNIVSYIHPIRTYLPCTGAGRVINNLLLGLAERKEVNLKLLFSAQWLNAEGKLDARSPLRHLPGCTFPTPENLTERSWKLIGRPKMDRYLPDNTDWLFAPAATYIPVTKCPVAITIYDIEAFEPDLPWSGSWQHRRYRFKWSQWVWRALRDCRIIFTISQFSKHRMVELLGADPDKIVVFGAGVEPAYFEVANADPAKLTLPVDEPYTLIIGGLRQKKGADYVLSVATALQDQKSPVHIVVAGQSEAQYVEAARHHPNLTLLGMVEDDALPGVLRGASSLLFLSCYEGFGIPAVEAMAAGIPAIVSNRGSLPEVVGDAGIVVDPTATDEIVEILTNLANNATLRHTYGLRGQQHARHYTWSRCTERVLDAFEQFA